MTAQPRQDIKLLTTETMEKKAEEDEALLFHAEEACSVEHRAGARISVPMTLPRIFIRLYAVSR